MQYCVWPSLVGFVIQNIPARARGSSSRRSVSNSASRLGRVSCALSGRSRSTSAEQGRRIDKHQHEILAGSDKHGRSFLNHTDHQKPTNAIEHETHGHKRRKKTTAERDIPCSVTSVSAVTYDMSSSWKASSCAYECVCIKVSKYECVCV